MQQARGWGVRPSRPMLWLWYKWHGGRNLAWEFACLVFTMICEASGYILGALIGFLIGRWLFG